MLILETESGSGAFYLSHTFVCSSILHISFFGNGRTCSTLKIDVYVYISKIITEASSRLELDYNLIYIYI